MNPFIQSVMDSPFFTVLTKPVQSVIRDAHNVLSIKTDVVSSIIRIISTVGFFIVGVLLVFMWSPELALKLESFWLALNAPEYMLSALVGYSGGWLISYPGNEIAAQTLRVINYCRFGDYDYFLTPSEITKVAKKIIKVESREASDLESVKETVQQVLEFCVGKIRSNEETVRDMANVYKRIFTSLRKGDLTPYYEDLTLIRTQEQKMAEVAKKGQAEIAKIERQIQALQDGVSVGDVSDSDMEDVDNTVATMGPQAASAHAQNISALQLMQDRVVAEIRRIEREVASLKDPREHDAYIDLAGSITAKDLSLQRSRLLERERDAWERFIVVLIKKKFSIESGAQALQAMITSVQAKQRKLTEVLESSGGHETVSALLSKMKVSLDTEMKSLEEQKAALDREYDAVLREVETNNEKLDATKREKSAVDEEIEKLVISSMEEIKQEISTLNEKVIENQVQIGSIEVEISLKEQERKDAEKKIAELDKKSGCDDVEAAMSTGTATATVDMNAGDDRSREVVVEEGDGDSDSERGKIELERESIVKEIRELSIFIERSYVHIRELEVHNRSIQSQIMRAREEIEKLSIGHILSSSMEDKYGTGSRDTERPMVLPPELMPTTSREQECRDSFVSGYGVELVRRAIDGERKESREAIAREWLDDEDISRTRQVHIEADSPPMRVRRRNPEPTTTHQYSRHLCSKDIRHKARHVHGMSQAERESMIKMLNGRRRHLHKVAQRAERRSKLTY